MSQSAPEAPDYAAAAEKTAEASKEAVTAQTWANRANQTNPWGSTSWTNAAVKDPATGQMVTQWHETTKLDPKLQAALNSQLQMQQGRSDLANELFPRAQTEFGQAMDWSGFTQMAQGPKAGNLQSTGIQRGLNFGGVNDVADSGASRQRAEDAIYQSATSRLDPQWQQRQGDLETQLANQGITRGSDAWKREMANFNTDRNDAYSQAQMQAITGGGAEAQRDYAIDMGLRQQQAQEIAQQGQFANAAQGQQFGQYQTAGNQNFQQQMATANYQNQMRQNQIAEAMQKRGFSLNEINALISGQQVSMPQFGSYNTAGQQQSADYSGAARDQYSASMDAFNAKQQQMANLMQGASGAASVFGFSDRRLKRNVRRIGTHPRGFGVYRYRFVGERGMRTGVIAQEVQRYAPELVRSVRGVLMVNYGGL